MMGGRLWDLQLVARSDLLLGAQEIEMGACSQIAQRLKPANKSSQNDNAADDRSNNRKQPSQHFQATVLLPSLNTVPASCV